MDCDPAPFGACICFLANWNVRNSSHTVPLYKLYMPCMSSGLPLSNYEWNSTFLLKLLLLSVLSQGQNTLGVDNDRGSKNSLSKCILWRKDYSMGSDRKLSHTLNALSSRLHVGLSICSEYDVQTQAAWVQISGPQLTELWLKLSYSGSLSPTVFRLLRFYKAFISTDFSGFPLNWVLARNVSQSRASLRKAARDKREQAVLPAKSRVRGSGILNALSRLPSWEINSFLIMQLNILTYALEISY